MSNFYNMPQWITRLWAEVNQIKAAMSEGIRSPTGSGAPTHAAKEGTHYWDTTNNKEYVNNNGSTGWTALN